MISSCSAEDVDPKHYLERRSKMTRLQVALYDAFSATVFGGNVAGVVPRAEGLSDLQMQQVAAELAAPTTGFAVELPEGGSSLLHARHGDRYVRPCGGWRL